MDKITTFKPAKFSFKKDYIIDSNDAHISFDDPRVVHVWPIDTSQYLTSLMKSFYNKRGLQFRACGKTDSEILRYAKKISSGKECLPFNSIAGCIYKDILSRDKNEISLYYSAGQNGPCQNSAWPIIFDTFCKKEKINNALFSVTLNSSSNYFGKGIGFIKDFASILYLSDLFEEAKSSLKCVAKDKIEAMNVFEDATAEVIYSAGDSTSKMKKAIKIWNRRVSLIPRSQSLNSVSKILVFGGLNVLFTNHPVLKYFEDKNIIVKCVDILEGVLWGSSYYIVKDGIDEGLLDPSQLFGLTRNLGHWVEYVFKRAIKRFRFMNRKERDRGKAFAAWLDIVYLEFISQRYRKLMKKSGLMYDKHISYKKLAEEGSKYVSHSAFTETSVTVGRYLNTIKNEVFDGLINLGTFNCQPAMNSSAVLRSVSNDYDIPFISMDCDGGELSSNQIRLLETITVQSMRYNKEMRKCVSAGVF